MIFLLGKWTSKCCSSPPFVSLQLSFQLCSNSTQHARKTANRAWLLSQRNASLWKQFMSRFYFYKCWALPCCTSSLEWFYSWIKELLSMSKCPETVYKKIKAINKQGKCIRFNCTREHSLERPGGSRRLRGGRLSTRVASPAAAPSPAVPFPGHQGQQNPSRMSPLWCHSNQVLTYNPVFPICWYSVLKRVYMPWNLLCISAFLSDCQPSSARIYFWHGIISLCLGNVVCTKKFRLQFQGEESSCGTCSELQAESGAGNS